MIKCFYTGIKLNDDEAYVLDLVQAREALRELRNKAFAIEKIIKELGKIDEVEVFISKKGRKLIQRRRRLVSKQLALAFSDSSGGKNIFVCWSEWISMTSKKNKSNK